jgi:dCTP deaminase
LAAHLTNLICSSLFSAAVTASFVRIRTLQTTLIISQLKRENGRTNWEITVKLIQDAELEKLIKAKVLLSVEGPAGTAVEATGEIKGCSVDLTIGSIYVPGTKENKLGSATKPRKDLPLAQGHTAVVVSRETINLTPNCAGLAFPASSVSLKGLLMTNPGHIDPGYCGKLHVTVINMGREPYSLKEGDRLVKLLVMELDAPSAKLPLNTGISPVNAELLNRLSQDFVNVSARAESAAKDEIARAQFRGYLVQALLPVITVALGIFGTWYVASHQLEERMGKVEALVPVVTRLDTLELQRLREVDDRVKTLEAKAKK